MPPLRFTINGQRWTVKFVRKGTIQSDGEPCYAKAYYDKRIIRVEKGITGALLIASIHHEFCHALAPNVLDCDFIDQLSTLIGDALTHPEIRGRI